MAMSLPLIVFIVCHMIRISVGQGCSFPDWMVKKPRTSSDFHGSWETESKVQNRHGPRIDDMSMTTNYVKIPDPHTLSIRSHFEQTGKDNYKYTYKCLKETGPNQYVLQSDDKQHYRCVEFLKRSKLVAQWRLGPEKDTADVCVEGFAALSPWPLVYWPVKKYNTHREGIFADLLQDYPSCPPLGGYEMRVLKHDGPSGGYCSKDYPSPRIEFECGGGEGILITAAWNNQFDCSTIPISEEVGIRLYCLGSWDSGKYTFSVVVPAMLSQTYGFHCLRMRKDDPTQEPAVLFIDNICAEEDPEEGTSFMKIELRRTFVNDICSDYSDQCQSDQIDCSETKQATACAKTCDSCPGNDDVFPFEIDLRGKWVLQKEHVGEEIVITKNSVTFPGLGKFKAYADSIDERCIQSVPVMNGSRNFVLATDPSNGCVPRVTQFRMKLVAPSVAIMTLSGTAPLRGNQFFQDPSQWCVNNQQELKWSSRVFQPYWPYARKTFYDTNVGWYTVVRHDSQDPSACKIPTYYAHIRSRLFMDLSETQNYFCGAESHQVTETRWMIQYTNCTNKVPPRELQFTCLANYEVSDIYRGVILKADKALIEGEPKATYYCLLYPTEENRNVYDIKMDAAGQCDVHQLLKPINNGYKKAMLTIERQYDIDPVIYKTIGAGESVMPSYLTVLLTIVVTFKH